MPARILLCDRVAVSYDLPARLLLSKCIGWTHILSRRDIRGHDRACFPCLLGSLSVLRCGVLGRFLLPDCFSDTSGDPLCYSLDDELRVQVYVSDPYPELNEHCERHKWSL